MRQAAQIGSTLRRRVRRHIGRAEFGPQIGRPASGRPAPRTAAWTAGPGARVDSRWVRRLPRRVRPGRPADPRGSQRSEQSHRSLITSETITISNRRPWDSKTSIPSVCRSRDHGHERPLMPLPEHVGTSAADHDHGDNGGGGRDSRVQHHPSGIQLRRLDSLTGPRTVCAIRGRCFM